jgi:YVTN family beta-propeller protein
VIVVGLSHPKAVAYNPNTNRLYITSRDNNLVYVLDGTTYNTLATIPVYDEPFGIAVNPITNKIYVATFRNGELWVIRGSDNRVKTHYNIGPEPCWVAVNKLTNKVYVTTHGNNGVVVVNGNTDSVERTMGSGGAGTWGITVNEDMNRIYVTNRDDQTITTIDGSTNTVLHSQTVRPDSPQGSVPYAITYDHTLGRVFVVYGIHSPPNRVAVFEAEVKGLNRLGTVWVGDGGPNGGGGIGVNPATHHVFVTNSRENTVTIFDGSSLTVLYTQPVGADPFALAVDGSGNRVFITNRGSQELWILPDVY